MEQLQNELECNDKKELTNLKLKNESRQVLGRALALTFKLVDT